VILNREPTPLDGLADVVLRGAIGECIGGIDSRVKSTPTSSMTDDEARMTRE
jgi:hypothetical protein